MNNKETTTEVSENNNHHIKVFLPKKLLECLPKCTVLPKERLRWNTNEEIASYLITFEKHEEWLSASPKTRPQNGTIILYNRKKVKYRKDGYCWKKRKDGKTTREDHMKLKVQGMECLYGCYVHSSIVPTFHRRCYWLLQNPDIVLVHYLNVPAIEDCGKICGPILCSINSDRKEWLKWSKEELICQLKPMFHAIKWTCSNRNATAEFSIEQLVQQILDSHQAKPQPRTHACLCNSGLGPTGNIPHKCSSTKHRIISPKVEIRPCPYPALTEVQNISTPEKSEQDQSKSSSPDLKDGKVEKVSLLTNGGSEVSSSSSHVDTPDSTQNSPVTITNGYYSDRELSSVTIATSVPNLTVATVTCSIPQNAVIVMTGLGDKSLSLGTSGLTPSQQLIATDPNNQGLPLGSHEISLTPTSSTIGLTLLPSTVGGLVLSQNLDANMETSETSTTFDPDSFLNSPKQGQTYGGGANKDTLSISSNFISPSTSESGLLGSSLGTEPKANGEKLDSGTSCSRDYGNPQAPTNVSIFPQASNLVSVSQTFPATAQVTLVSSSVTSSTVLEKMDCSSSESPKNFLFSKQPTNHSSASSTQNRFFIRDDDDDGQPLRRATAVVAPRVSLSPEVKPGPQFQQERASGNVKEELRSPVQLVSFQGVPAESETPMETTSCLNGDGDAMKPQPAADGERSIKPEDGATSQYPIDNTQETVGETSDLQDNNINDLYTIIQNDLTSSSVTSSNMDLNIDHFDISFDSQFPDLISDFITEDGAGANGFGQFSTSPSTLAPPVSHSHSASPTFTANGASPIGSYASQLQTTSQFLNPTDNISYPAMAPANSEQTPPGNAREPERPVPITDFSPEWSYPEGGVKVLITGLWTEGAERYSCMFDQVTVPASLIQSGVLRCYCPAHEAGLVTLQVARENRILSNSVLFEYRARNSMALPSTQLDWLSLDDNQFRMSILERLEQMEKRMDEMMASSQQQPQLPPPPPPKEGSGDHTRVQTPSDSFEDRIIAVCEKMMSRPCWLRSERLVHDISFRGMTLLHLAAAQGYTRLIETLIRWRTVNAESLDLEQEVDPLNVDHFSCTPLMWACALGHIDAAVILYRWNGQALAIPDSLGRLPLNVARSRGHVRLATCLEELQRQDQKEQEMPLRGRSLFQEADLAERNWQHLVGSTPDLIRLHSPLSASPDTGLSTLSSISSPSELSERSLSVTSTYSSGCALRGSPACSPEPENVLEFAMEISESQQVATSSSPAAPCPAKPAGKAVPRAEGPGALEGQETALHSWYPKEDQLPTKTRNPMLHCSSANSTFFMEYEAALVGNGTPAFSTGRDVLEAELLSYSENAENEEYLPPVEVLQVDMIALAEQIIEATPERIKQEDFSCMEAPLRERQDNATINETMSWLASYLENVDQLPSFSQHRSVCTEPLTPPSSNVCLSPINSPLSDITFEKFDSASSADWSDFLNASANGKMESEFALLTLSDHEQRELYEAARIIQTAFRKYKGRRLKEQQEMAAAVIQKCYRKYKQYALYKKMTQAAILIQSKFRSYYEQKKFQQSRRAAVLIQQYYRSYKEYEKLKQGHRGSASIQQKMKGSFLTKKQDQAARKIMRFLRRCRHRMKELKQRKELDGLQKRGLTT
ncbi:calmodulin-binding transcription activator 2 isoform X2 [Latimeria chalumnae]|uniref:Calmodulin-binding transcription activator 1 n=1 Tax=Latimeria chalumnae TaxID=7897 RepID=M3XK15_LATCH|nr:PREDICTED: calmodulin-binding transcription activator 2 isoform X2 [Latimeria chalumnae]|eukprot:XP_005999870.1 PREDICTED: calmodulin-binding transcription activator 2 isoform X2 [Latimeria chalumnae]